MVYGAVAFEEMRSKLLTLDTARERLAATEPINERSFPTGPEVKFELGADWADTELTEPTTAWLTTPSGVRHQMTKQAVLEAGARPGIPRGYAQRLSPSLLEADLNWWFRSGLGNEDVKVLVLDRRDEEPLARAMTRATINPFSNLELLDRLLEGVRAKYGDSTEILVDYKFHHDLERTNVRLIIPGTERTISGTRVADDTWCAGVQFANSLVGLSHPGTSVQGYLFRWWCTNGETDTLHSTGKLSRNTITEPEDAYAWARRSVDEILERLEGSFDAVQELARIPVGEGHVPVSQILEELYDQHTIPQRERGRITSEMAELGGDLTLYDVQSAVTRAANAEDASPRTVDRLLQLGGYIAHAGHERCPTCHSQMPDGWHPHGQSAN